MVCRNAKKADDKIQSLEREISSIDEKIKDLYLEITSLEDEAKEAISSEKSAEVNNKYNGKDLLVIMFISE